MVLESWGAAWVAQVPWVALWCQSSHAWEAPLLAVVVEVAAREEQVEAAPYGLSTLLWVAMVVEPAAREEQEVVVLCDLSTPLWVAMVVEVVAREGQVEVVLYDLSIPP